MWDHLTVRRCWLPVAAAFAINAPPAATVAPLGAFPLPANVHQVECAPPLQWEGGRWDRTTGTIYLDVTLCSAMAAVREGQSGITVDRLAALGIFIVGHETQHALSDPVYDDAAANCYGYRFWFKDGLELGFPLGALKRLWPWVKWFRSCG